MEIEIWLKYLLVQIPDILAGFHTGTLKLASATEKWVFYRLMLLAITVVNLSG